MRRSHLSCACLMSGGHVEGFAAVINPSFCLRSMRLGHFLHAAMSITKKICIRRAHAAAPFLFILLSILSSPSQATRPLITDDARIIDAQSCQLESWVKHGRDGDEVWALPGCNFTGNLELTLGGAQSRNDGAVRESAYLLQAKILFKTLEPNGWAWGLAVGNMNRPGSAGVGNLNGNTYGYVPASFSFHDDGLIIHTNLGGVHERTTGRNRSTWGVGAEVELNPHAWVIAETYGQSGDAPFWQAGLRYWLIPGHVQIDTTFGRRFGGAPDVLQARWMSIGIRVLSLPFLR